MKGNPHIHRKNLVNTTKKTENRNITFKISGHPLHFAVQRNERLEKQLITRVCIFV